MIKIEAVVVKRSRVVEKGVVWWLRWFEEHWGLGNAECVRPQVIEGGLLLHQWFVWCGAPAVSNRVLNVKQFGGDGVCKFVVFSGVVWAGP